jgi:hypothetical protein
MKARKTVQVQDYEEEQEEDEEKQKGSRELLGLLLVCLRLACGWSNIKLVTISKG